METSRRSIELCCNTNHQDGNNSWSDKSIASLGAFNRLFWHVLLFDSSTKSYSCFSEDFE